MADYIDRCGLAKCIEDTLCKGCDNHNGILCGNCLVDDALSLLKDYPAAAVKPVEYGHWIVINECANAGIYCSVCHKKVYKERYANVGAKSKFCPNCGKRMMDVSTDDGAPTAGDGWVSVTEIMPNIGTLVLTYARDEVTGYRSYNIGEWRGTYWDLCGEVEDDNITYWKKVVPPQEDSL